MVYARMVGKPAFVLQVLVPTRLVGHDRRFSVHIDADDRQQGSDRGAIDVEAASRSATLNQRHDDVAVMVATGHMPRRAFAAAGCRLIDFDNASGAALWVQAR